MAVDMEKSDPFSAQADQSTTCSINYVETEGKTWHQNERTAQTDWENACSSAQNQKAVSAYFATSKQILPFGFAEHCSTLLPGHIVLPSCRSTCRPWATTRGGRKRGHLTTCLGHIIDGRVAESFANHVSKLETSPVIFCLKFHYIHH